MAHHRWMGYDPETEPLYQETNIRREQETKRWDVFRDPPKKVATGSMVEHKYVNLGEKAAKVLAYLITFIVVLGCAALSKGTLLFMTSQISDTVTRPVCEGPDGPYDRYTVTLDPREKIAWMWVILFTFSAPQLGTLFRSVRIIAFKTWQRPTILDFLSIFITESLPTIGLGLLVFKILPSLDVVRGAMLTNSVCLVPAILNLISRYRTVIDDDDDDKKREPNNFLKIVLDVVAIVGQASALVIWPLLYSDRIDDWSNIYLIPISVVLISCGWWENYVSDDSNFAFIRAIAKNKKKFDFSRYYVYIFVSIWKCALFLGVMFISPPEGVSRDAMLNDFVKAFSDHHLLKMPVENHQNQSTVFMETYGEAIDVNGLTPLWVFLMNIASTYICYAFGKFACKIYIQGFSYAFPINLAVPVTISVLIAMCGEYVKDPCTYFDHIPVYLFYNVPEVNYLWNFLSEDHVWVWLLWLLSQAWITVHIWTPTCEKLASTERLYVRPMFDPFLIDQDIALNRRRNDKPLKIEEEEFDSNDVEYISDLNHVDQKGVDEDDTMTRIYACGTMWHETREEMMEFLKSVMRLDEDQSARRIVKDYLKLDIPDYYELETHIFFDDAFVRVAQDDPDPQINQWVKELVEAVDDAASEVHETIIRVRPPKKYITPYGGRLVWTLPGKNKMIAHLKDKKKIRAKKRWSQVMYMYYLLGHKLMELDISVARKELRAENTYILALDGDIDFQPKAVHLLVELMKKNKSLGAACGRIHPLGSGPMVWYQMFEYSIGHWLQKATEHVIGCVLCSPGCFSLFRGKALMDDSVMRKYTTKSSEARHYVQYDQGEDRWLCTLLLQRGYRVEYSAASDSYTHCPEGFNEFYNQRRRWMPSTTANILDLLAASKQTIKVNDNISLGYIMYQGVLMVGTVLGPGTIFVMLVGAFVAAFQLDQWSSFLWNVIPILFFVLVCTFFTDDKIQLFVAGILSGIYGLIMMAVLVGVALQISSDGFLAPSSLFFFCVVSQIVVTAFLHPKELNCLKYGIVYYVTIPSMYMLLVIYSVFNMNNVSWGTREVTVVEKPAAGAEGEKAPGAKAKNESKPKSRVLRFLGGKDDDNTGSITCSLASLCKCMWCTHKDDKEETELHQMNAKIDAVMKKLEDLERGEISELETRMSQMPRVSQMPRMSQMPRTSQMPRNSHMPRPSRRTTTTLLTGLTMQQALDVTSSDTQSIPETTVSEEVAENTWLDDPVLQKGEVDFIDSDEYNFFNGLLDKYLYPIDDGENKARIQQNLKDLRDKVVLAFFMINALFILVIFLLTLKKDDLHIKWPLEVKINFTYVDDLQEIWVYREYLQLEPIGIVFLFGFAALLVIQFGAMLIHRFQTLSQILSNTVLSFSCFKTSTKSLTDDEILEMDAVTASKQLQKLKGVDSDDEEHEELVPGRRKTIHQLAKNGRKNFQATTDLENAFKRRWGKIRTGGEYKGPIPRQTLRALNARMSRVERQSVINLRHPMNGGHTNSGFEMDA